MSTAPALTIDILDLIQQRANIQLDSRPSRHFKDGIEHHSNCPWCGGKNRFAIWPEVGRYSCSVRASGCGKHGDAIQFLRDFCDMSFREACQELDIDYRYPEDAMTRLPLFMTRDEPPNKKWMDAAESFVWRAEKYLWSSGGIKAQIYLQSRGLSEHTIRSARLGYCPGWYSENLETWGLTPEQTDPGQNEIKIPDLQYPQSGSNQIVQASSLGESIIPQSTLEIKIPEGIILPYFVEGKIWKIQVRRPDGNYFQTLGSSDALFNIDSLRSNESVVLAEGEFDALSVLQTSYDFVASVATGGASKGMVTRWITKLKTASHVLVAFDQDEAGDAGAKIWITRLGEDKASRWTPWAHDCNDMLRTGISIRTWVEIGLKSIATKLETPVVVEPQITIPEPQITTTPPALYIPHWQRNPFVKRNEQKLLYFCSICKWEPAIRWVSNTEHEKAWCKKCWPGYEWWEAIPLP